MNQTSIYKSFSLSRHFKRDGIARLASDLVNPLLLPPVVIGLVSWMLGLPSASLITTVAISLFFYTLLPVSATFYLLKRDRITSIDLPEQKSRSRLFLFSIGCAAAAFLCISLAMTPAHPLLGTIAFIFLLNPIIGFLINFKWKMSIHTAALSTAGAVFFVVSYLDMASSMLPIFIFLLLMPLIIWARYRLNIHSVGELLGGAFSGFLLTIVELSLLINV